MLLGSSTATPSTRPTRWRGIYDELEKVSRQVLAGEVTDTLAGEVLAEIARQEDLNGRIRRNVTGHPACASVS